MRPRASICATRGFAERSEEELEDCELALSTADHGQTIVVGASEKDPLTPSRASRPATSAALKTRPRRRACAAAPRVHRGEPSEQDAHLLDAARALRHREECILLHTQLDTLVARRGTQGVDEVVAVRRLDEDASPLLLGERVAVEPLAQLFLEERRDAERRELRAVLLRAGGVQRARSSPRRGGCECRTAAADRCRAAGCRADAARHQAASASTSGASNISTTTTACSASFCVDDSPLAAAPAQQLEARGGDAHDGNPFVSSPSTRTRVPLPTPGGPTRTGGGSALGHRTRRAGGVGDRTVRAPELCSKERRQLPRRRVVADDALLELLVQQRGRRVTACPPRDGRPCPVRDGGGGAGGALECVVQEGHARRDAHRRNRAEHRGLGGEDLVHLEPERHPALNEHLTELRAREPAGEAVARRRSAQRALALAGGQRRRASRAA